MCQLGRHFQGARAARVQGARPLLSKVHAQRWKPAQGRVFLYLQGARKRRVARGCTHRLCPRCTHKVGNLHKAECCTCRVPGNALTLPPLRNAVSRYAQVRFSFHCRRYAYDLFSSASTNLYTTLKVDLCPEPRTPQP